MRDTLSIEPRTSVWGAGIYDIVDDDGDYTGRVFVTDTGKALFMTERVLNEDDLLTVFQWGVAAGRADKSEPVRKADPNGGPQW